MARGARSRRASSTITRLRRGTACASTRPTASTCISTTSAARPSRRRSARSARTAASSRAARSRATTRRARSRGHGTSSCSSRSGCGCRGSSSSTTSSGTQRSSPRSAPLVADGTIRYRETVVDGIDARAGGVHRAAHRREHREDARPRRARAVKLASARSQRVCVEEPEASVFTPRDRPCSDACVRPAASSALRRLPTYAPSAVRPVLGDLNRARAHHDAVGERRRRGRLLRCRDAEPGIERHAVRERARRGRRARRAPTRARSAPRSFPSP